MKTRRVILLFALVLEGCGEDTQPARLPATEEVLSQYQTIYIGSEALTLPTIALLSSTKHSNLTLQDGSQVSIKNVLSQSTNGARVSLIGLSIHAYRQLQDYDLDKHAYVSAAFCERLLAGWERSQCKLGLYGGKNSFYPQYFQVVERSYLLSSNDQLFAIGGGGPTGGAAARKLLEQPSETQFMCEPRQQPLCTAAMLIRKNIVVVWATRREDFDADRKRISWLMEQYFGKKPVDAPNSSVTRDAVPAGRLRVPYLHRYGAETVLRNGRGNCASFSIIHIDSAVRQSTGYGQ